MYVSIMLLVACSNEREPQRSTEVSIAYLCSMATASVVDVKHDYTIRGDVVANDIFGEVSNSFVVTDDTGGVVVEVDSPHVYARVPLFSNVAIRCSGLSLGRTNGRVVLGIRSDDGSVTHIPEEDIYSHIAVDSTSLRHVEPLHRHIRDITTDDMLRYVYVEALRATERGVAWTDVDTLTGDRITTVRHFSDGSSTLRVVTAGDCAYAAQMLPEGVVTLAGIVDWYDGAIALRVTNRGVIHINE